MVEYFWDSEEAEQEYYEVGSRIAEAEEKLEEKLAEPQSRLLTIQAVYNYFAGAPGVATVLRESSPYRSREWKDKNLNHALNPYWLPADGRISPDHPPVPWRGSLIVQKVESETCQGAVVFRCYVRGEDVDRSMAYSYERRVEWFTSTGDVGMSGIEKSLLAARESPGKSNVLYDKLLQELIQEVRAFTAPFCQQMALRFIPDLAPTNIEEIHYRYYLGKGAKWDKSLLSLLSWPPLTRYEAPKSGERYGLASYKGICWVCYGQWEAHQFTPAQLEAARERIERMEDRLRERIVAADREVACIEEEIALLRRRKKKIRTLHYKPLMFREFWSAMQTTQRQDVD